jgi:hypothetical protein
MERLVSARHRLFPTGHWALSNPKGAISDKWVSKCASGAVLPGDDWYVHEWADATRSVQVVEETSSCRVERKLFCLQTGYAVVHSCLNPSVSEMSLEDLCVLSRDTLDAASTFWAHDDAGGSVLVEAKTQEVRAFPWSEPGVAPFSFILGDPVAFACKQSVTDKHSLVLATHFAAHWVPGVRRVRVTLLNVAGTQLLAGCWITWDLAPTV